MMSMRRFGAREAGSTSSSAASARSLRSLVTFIEAPYTAFARALLALGGELSHSRSPQSLLDSAAHSWTHPEGWRDWPYEAPATTASHGGEGPNPARCVAGSPALFHTGSP